MKPTHAAVQTALRQLGPGLAKTSVSRREQAEERAAVAFRRGFEATAMPERAVARRLGVDSRVVRDWRSGSRAVPTWAIMALPRDGQLAALYELVGFVPPSEADDPSEDFEEEGRKTA